MPKDTSLAFSTSPSLAVQCHLMYYFQQSDGCNWLLKLSLTLNSIPTFLTAPKSGCLTEILNSTCLQLNPKILCPNFVFHIWPHHCLVPQPWNLASFLIPPPWHLQLQNFINSLFKPLVSIPPTPSSLLFPKLKLSSLLVVSDSKHLPFAVTILTFSSDHGSSIPHEPNVPAKQNVMLSIHAPQFSASLFFYLGMLHLSSSCNLPYLHV